MTRNRFVARHAFLLLAALSMGGCLSESDPELTGVPVSLEITGPASASQLETTDETVKLAGEASSEQGIYRVTWSSDRGRKGVAFGTDSWETESIALELGDNEITVTAEDVSGAQNSRSVKVKRESGRKGSATLSWSPPTTRVDGSALNDLAGYKIEYGRMSGVYDYQIDVNNPGISTYVVENLVSGEWFFAVAAYDSKGLESDPSNEATHTID